MAELEVFSGEALEAMNLNEIKGDVATLEGETCIPCRPYGLCSQVICGLPERVKNAKPNMSLLAEYRQREAEFLSRAKDLDDITVARDTSKARFDQLRKTRLEQFMTGFNTISSKLKEMYQVCSRPRVQVRSNTQLCRFRR
jgi:structural maintenance of chromosome 4